MSVISPRRTSFRLNGVEGYLLLGMSASALREVDAVRASGHSSVRVCELRAEALRGLERHAEALAEFEAADKRAPGQLATLMGMAWCLKRVDRLDDAIDVMHRAYQLHSDEPVVLYNIACYHALAGDKQQALSWLGRALRMEPALRKLIPAETDFAQLREDPDFQFIVSDLRSREEST